MSVRDGLAGLVGLSGLVLAVVLLARESGPMSPPEARVDVEEATAATLDTLSLRGRRVFASVEGWVAQVDASGEVWLTADGDALPLRFDGEHGLEVEDHVLAVGRLRARSGRRWLEVTGWTVVRADVRPPAESGL